MNRQDAPLLPATARGTQIALIYALVAERLTSFYEHDHWLTEAQGASLAADWLNRTKRSLPLAERKHLSALSDDLARQIAASLSREAGLLTAHEMQESLDANYVSEIGNALMLECERVLDAAASAE
ncbi:MAG: hypothetical protein H6943_10065 [Zoogloeaceae bacterium]|nr:hypothetical protein [Zoogloeaceae bacterium]